MTNANVKKKQKHAVSRPCLYLRRLNGIGNNIVISWLSMRIGAHYNMYPWSLDIEVLRNSPVHNINGFNMFQMKEVRLKLLSASWCFSCPLAFPILFSGLYQFKLPVVSRLRYAAMRILSNYLPVTTSQTVKQGWFSEKWCSMNPEHLLSNPSRLVSSKHVYSSWRHTWHDHRP